MSEEQLIEVLTQMSISLCEIRESLRDVPEVCEATITALVEQQSLVEGLAEGLVGNYSFELKPKRLDAEIDGTG